MKEGNTPYVAFVPNINLQVKKNNKLNHRREETHCGRLHGLEINILLVLAVKLKGQGSPQPHALDLKTQRVKQVFPR